MSTLKEIHFKLSQYHQEHLLKFWDELTDPQKKQLLDDLSEINLEDVISDFRKITSESLTFKKYDDNIQPVPDTLFGNIDKTPTETLKFYEKLGLELISRGKLAVLVLAGGQGTRLGVSYPKGMYNVQLPSQKTLFQIQAERIRKLEELAEKKTKMSGSIIWYVMTSESTMEATMEFFNKNNFFGLDKKNVIMFEQFMLPAFSFDGKIILQDKHKIAMSPDGNGGLYRALRDRQILEQMESKGVEYVHAFSIDNIIVKVGDPIFLGYCVEQRSDCAVKVIEKTEPNESIGVVCKVDNKWKVVEYSEISMEASGKRTGNGRLVFQAGNICNHLFSTEFLRKIIDNFIPELELHVASKKIPNIDEDGKQVNPTKPNGIKMERFIFDVFPYSENLVVWQVNRKEEFSALKNTDEVGFDCPKTSRQSLINLHKIWIEKAGGMFEDGNPLCEISPLVSYGGEGLKLLVNGKKLVSPFILKSEIE